MSVEEFVMQYPMPGTSVENDSNAPKNLVESPEVRIHSGPELIGGLAIFGERMRQIAEIVRKVAVTNVSVLLTGESGVGKELVARAIHALSRRKEKNYAVIDCCSLTSSLAESELFGHEQGSFTGSRGTGNGLFGEADGGTVFIDELSSLELAIQPKLLRVLEEGAYRRVGGHKYHKVDVRIVSATNQPLKELMKEGKFRQDLFYRLNVFPIEVPPLRKRDDEIIPLANFILERLEPRGALLSSDALSLMQTYRWPGNVREMKNTLRRALVLKDEDTIGLKDLPEEMTEHA